MAKFPTCRGRARFAGPGNAIGTCSRVRPGHRARRSGGQRWRAAVTRHAIAALRCARSAPACSRSARSRNASRMRAGDRTALVAPPSHARSQCRSSLSSRVGELSSGPRRWMALTLGRRDLPCCSHDSHPSGRCRSGQPRSCRDVRAVPRSLVDRASRSAKQQCRRRGWQNQGAWLAATQLTSEASHRGWGPRRHRRRGGVLPVESWYTFKGRVARCEALPDPRRR